MIDEKRLLGMIGMCKRAGKAIIGTPMICEHLRKRGIAVCESETEVLVLEASDSSDNTHKKLSDKCNYYNVKLIRLTTTCDDLGRAVGKSAVAAVAIADKNFCRGILAIIKEDQ